MVVVVAKELIRLPLLPVEVAALGCSVQAVRGQAQGERQGQMAG